MLSPIAVFSLGRVTVGGVRRATRMRRKFAGPYRKPPSILTKSHLKVVTPRGAASRRLVRGPRVSSRSQRRSRLRLSLSVCTGSPHCIEFLDPDSPRELSLGAARDGLIAHVVPTFTQITSLYRSGDHGRTWKELFQFAPGYGTLASHSVRDDGRHAGVASCNCSKLALPVAPTLWPFTTRYARFRCERKRRKPDCAGAAPVRDR
jgi:hypothetical protein